MHMSIHPVEPTRLKFDISQSFNCFGARAIAFMRPRISHGTYVHSWRGLAANLPTPRIQPSCVQRVKTLSYDRRVSYLSAS